MIAAFINRLSNKTFLCSVFVFLLLLWILYGNSILLSLGESKTEKYVNAQVARLKESNPVAGAALASFTRERDIRAVAASLKMYDNETNGQPVHSLARDLANNHGEGLRWYALSAVGINKFAQRPVEERNEFLNTHGAVYQNTLAFDPTGTMANDYAEAIFTASGDSPNWRVIASDPAALAFQRVLKSDVSAWEYYVKERDWLDNVLVSLPVPKDEIASYAPAVLDAVQTANRYAPLFKKAYQAKLEAEPDADPMIGVALLEQFAVHGDFLVAVDKLGVPVTEMIDILYANPTEFSFSETPSLRNSEMARKAEEMQYIKINKPNVWQRASEEANFLWLEQVAPDQAEYIAEAYSHGGVQALLLSYYEDIAPTAAQAIVTYGDLGIYMLSRYRDDEVFHRHLANEKIGIRVVPYLAKFPDDGLYSLGNNTKWLDKYFNPDGSEKDQGWVKDIPLVGGPANVVGNLLDGVPNTWGELGWAAFDVADSALLIASFGTSSAVTQGTKQVARQGMKRLVVRVAPNAAKGAIAKATSTHTIRSLLARVVAVGYRSVRWGVRTTISVGNTAWKAARTTWKTIPPTIRRVITRSIAVGMIFYSYDRRDTAAAIKKGMEALGTKAGEAAYALGTGALSGFANAVNESLGGIGNNLPQAVRYLIWGGGAFALAFAAYRAKPSRRDLTAFVKGV